MKSRCLLNSCNSTSQFISIMFRCCLILFFYQKKNFVFLLWVNLYMITGIYLHDPPSFNGPFFMTPPFSESQKVVTLPLFPPPSPLLISDKSLRSNLNWNRCIYFLPMFRKARPSFLRVLHIMKRFAKTLQLEIKNRGKRSRSQSPRWASRRKRKTGFHLAPARFALFLFLYPTCRREVRIVSSRWLYRLASFCLKALRSKFCLYYNIH